MTVDRRTAGGAVLLVGAVGVVFGDIGTSTLYTMTAVLKESEGARGLDEALVLGATSTLIWTLLVVVTVLYVGVLLRTDNDGDGGLLALLGLLRSRVSGRRLAVLTGLGMVGAAMFLGDSVITPAISVLSAAEGIELVEPSWSGAVVPFALVVLVALFLLQRFGTGVVGHLFGPVMLLWFGVVALLGLVALVREPRALEALSPHWIVLYFVDEPLGAFLSLGSVVLAVTGAEALYADLGHFGRQAISRAWLLVVMPALVVGYLGQAATVLRDPATAANPFFALAPDWARIPLVVLATAATVIASQAVISGAFTVVHQAWRLGLLPPLRLVHTSRRHVKQVYVPAVNWLLGFAVLAVVLTFRSSASLTAAYGVAVTTTVTVTTTLYLALSRPRDGRAGPRFVVACGCLVVVLVLLVATLPKVVSGGWLPLGIGAVLVVVMTTWRAGRARIDHVRHEEEAAVADLLAEVDHGDPPVRRVEGSAVFLTYSEGVAPIAMRTMVEQNHVLQEQAVLLSWSNEDTPRAPADDRVTVDRLRDDDGVVQVHVRVGYREHLDVHRVLVEATRACDGELDGLDPETAVFFVSLPVARFDPHGGLARWRQRVYLALDRIVPDPVDGLDLPRDRTIVIGREVGL